MYRMDWKSAIQAWRKLPPEEQQRIRRARLPRKVARSMAFEGEPVSQQMLEAELARLTQPQDTSAPPSVS